MARRPFAAVRKTLEDSSEQAVTQGQGSLGAHPISAIHRANRAGNQPFLRTDGARRALPRSKAQTMAGVAQASSPFGHAGYGSAAAIAPVTTSRVAGSHGSYPSTLIARSQVYC